MEKLFVGGLPLEINEIQLAQLFSIYGEVSTIKIVYDRASKKCKGYGFIEMVSREAAGSAIQALNGATMGERQLSVKIVPEEKNTGSNSASHPAPIYQKVERKNEPAKKLRPRRPRLNS